MLPLALQRKYDARLAGRSARIAAGLEAILAFITRPLGGCSCVLTAANDPRPTG